MNGIASALGIRDVMLHAANGQHAAERTAPAVLDRVAEALHRRWLADNTRVDGLAARAQRVDDGGGAVGRIAFLVARQQQRDGAAMGWRAGHDALDRGHHRRDGSLHVGRATSDEPAVALDGREWIVRPLLDSPRRHDVHMTRKTHDRRARSVRRPQIRDTTAIDSLADESERRQSLRHDIQTAVVVRRDRATRDQRLRQGQCRVLNLTVGHVSLSTTH
jgi:hypothetical protein